ncbi:MAG TPA: hydrogenase expression/formation protein HypE, partial [Planctomycetes bacterium]|nr:hydrogenase expression/formation protein HypE [Planctomycetota bacterium]
MPHGDRIVLAHGGGGRKTSELLRSLILPLLGERAVPALNDAEPLPSHPELYVTTDAYTVKPAFFPGGDAGRLAVIGTANDLAVAGARPLWLAMSLIIEEGVPVADLEKLLRSAGAALAETDLTLLAGDTKTVEKGAGDGVYITTTGIGRRIAPSPLSIKEIRTGDELVISGPPGRHGAAVLAARLGMRTDGLSSDLAPLFPLIQAAVDASIPLRCARDLT